MTRGLTTSLKNALTAKVVRAGYLVAMETSGGTIYMTTRATDVSWNSHTWIANHWLRPSFNIGESIEVKAASAKVKLAGIDPDALSLILSGLTHSRRAYIYIAAFEESGALVADPYQIFQGFFDGAEVNDTGLTAEIIVSYENEMLRASDASAIRMTHYSQQERFPGDMGFQYAALVEDANFFWGTAERPVFEKKRKRKNK